MSKIRIILVDDHNVLRTGLKLLISAQSDMEVVAEADNSSDVLASAEKLRPDVILLDLSLPGGPSLPLISKLSAMGTTPRVLILTMHDDPAYVRAALGAGARGYLVKTIGEHDLLEAIRSVHYGRLIVDLDDEIQTSTVFQWLGAKHIGDGPRVATKLSIREDEVLRFLGRGFSNQAIAEQLELSPKTVATYRARISEKLGLRTTAEFVRYATNTGTAGPKLE